MPDGLVVRGPDGSIAVVDHGHRRQIPDAETFRNLGLSVRHINEVTQEQYDLLPPGSPYPHLDSRLISRPGFIYLLDLGTRRHVPDMDTLRSLCLDQPVQSLSPETALSIPEGRPLPRSSSGCSQWKPVK